VQLQGFVFTVGKLGFSGPSFATGEFCQFYSVWLITVFAIRRAKVACLPMPP